jgi:hypothetical protein
MNSAFNTANPNLIDSVLEVLSQGEGLLSEMDNEVYTVKVPAAFNATIGGHYRHGLDHFKALLDCAESGVVNYDHRERGTLVETDRFAALNATRELLSAFESLDPELLGRRLSITCKTSYSSTSSQTAQSTVAREIMYAVAHAVHHYALIGVMGGLLGLKLPPGFGVAPSTIKHQETIGINK